MKIDRKLREQMPLPVSHSDEAQGESHRAALSSDAHDAIRRASDDGSRTTDSRSSPAEAKARNPWLEESTIWKASWPVRVVGSKLRAGTRRRIRWVAKYAWWIAKTRILFPKIEIMAGLTPKKAEDYAGLLLSAGANAITKFPAVKRFGTAQARTIEHAAKQAGRQFHGSLTKMPAVNWQSEVESLPFEADLKKRISEKLAQYIEKMSEQAHT